MYVKLHPSSVHYYLHVIMLGTSTHHKNIKTYIITSNCHLQRDYFLCILPGVFRKFMVYKKYMRRVVNAD